MNDEYNTKRNKIIATLLNYPNQDDDWVCEKSPSGYCEYTDTDTHKDSCVYCGEPKERK